MASDDLIELYLSRLSERGCTDATIVSVRRFLTIADERLPYGLDASSEDEIRAYLHRTRKPLSFSSRQTYHSAMNSFYEWATAANLLLRNPMDNIPAPKLGQRLPRVAETNQVRWLVTEAVEPFRTWAILAAFGGLRCIEVSRLHREHVSAETIVVERGKGNKARVIPAHPLVWSAVQPLPAGPLTDCTPNQVSTRFWKYCAREHLTELSMHRLRGWCASESYAATNDVLAVGQNLGHKDPRTTAGYIRISRKQARAAIDGLPTFGQCEASSARSAPASH
jgi:site-specific recombinase XerD